MYKTHVHRIYVAIITSIKHALLILLVDTQALGFFIPRAQYSVYAFEIYDYLTTVYATRKVNRETAKYEVQPQNQSKWSHTSG